MSDNNLTVVDVSQVDFCLNYTNNGDQSVGLNVFPSASVFCGFMIPCLLVGVYYHDELHRPLNVMIVNLSISQLLMLLITVFGSIIVMLQNDEYTDWLRFPDHREVLCFLTLLFSVSTSVFYGLIAFNRLLSTVFEGLYNKLAPWILCAVLVVAGWLLSAFGAAFPWMTKYMVFGKDTYFLLGYPWFAAAPCNDGLTNRGIFWLVTSAYFILPALSTIVCYVVILIFIFKTQRLAGLPVNSPRAINLRDRARVLLMLSSASLMYLLCFFLPMIFWSTSSGKRTSASVLGLCAVGVANVPTTTDGNEEYSRLVACMTEKDILDPHRLPSRAQKIASFSRTTLIRAHRLYVMRTLLPQSPRPPLLLTPCTQNKTETDPDCRTQILSPPRFAFNLPFIQELKFEPVLFCVNVDITTLLLLVT
ncbi:hypothetical protein RvY_09134-1 [Ramazzottius varieornatus]|uniref:G-protein coupled receptors family 1 profile domain-containing protein n=1 Tax=Ramazzottius varieornatus TaxID=947166 RepID=A0A1D1VG84_RAMVA|nr:hypothetical protein RvY_09134-1 [Ramazzottius varieornatus]